MSEFASPGAIVRVRLLSLAIACTFGAVPAFEKTGVDDHRIARIDQGAGERCEMRIVGIDRRARVSGLRQFPGLARTQRTGGALAFEIAAEADRTDAHGQRGARHRFARA